MKKRSLLLTCMLLVVTLALALCGCSSYGSIKSAFEKEGYTVTDASNEDIEKYLDEQGANVCHVHFASKTASHALIFEFNSTKDMEEQINKSETLNGIIKDLQKSDLVNGNCCIVSISPEALKIFRDTKG